MDCREECAALRRENRRLLKRIEALHADLAAETKRADAEAKRADENYTWALSMIGRAA